MSNALPSALYRAAQVRALDRQAIDVEGIPGLELMRRAGRFCYAQWRAQWPAARRIAVLCGNGNNGGDGFVIATLARADGLSVDVWQLGERTAMSADARAAYDAMREVGVEPVAGEPGGLADHDLVVDALLGTGLTRTLEGRFAAAVHEINSSRVPVVAVDIPTGLHADTGAELGIAVRAHMTCTFIGLKIGLFTGRGPACAGAVRFSDLDVPAGVYAIERPAAALRTAAVLAERLGPRARDAHKGDFGHVLLVGGDRGYAGAVLLSARACARAGAGLVSVATRPEHAGALVPGCPEAMFSAVAEPADARGLMSRASVLAVGPGLGQGDWGRELLRFAVESGKPLVLDADALNLLASNSVALSPAQGALRVLTPHPGEAARLLNTSTATIQADRIAAARELVSRYQAIVVLKGAGTVVCGEEEGEVQTSITAAGNPGLAAGGSGDTLTGITAALLAQRRALGLSAFAAVETAVCAHGAAADLAARDGERGMTASDVVSALRTSMNPDRGVR